jgi:hypothetical protein
MDQVTQGAWNLLGAMKFTDAERVSQNEVALTVTLDTPSGETVGLYVMGLDEARTMRDSLAEALA